MSALRIEKIFLETWRGSSREESGIQNMQVRGCHENKVVKVFPLFADRTVRRILGTQNMFKTAWLIEKSSKGHAHTNENKTASIPCGIAYIINEVTRHFAARQFHSFHISSLNRTHPCKATYTTCIKVIKFINLHFFSYLHYFFPSHLIYFLSLSFDSRKQTSPLPAHRQQVQNIPDVRLSRLELQADHMSVPRSRN